MTDATALPVAPDDTAEADLTLAIQRSAKNGQLYASEIKATNASDFPPGEKVRLRAVIVGARGDDGTPGQLPPVIGAIAPAVSDLDLVVGLPYLLAVQVTDTLGRPYTFASIAVLSSNEAKLTASQGIYVTDGFGVFTAVLNPLDDATGVTLTFTHGAVSAAVTVDITTPAAVLGSVQLSQSTLTVPADGENVAIGVTALDTEGRGFTGTLDVLGTDDTKAAPTAATVNVVNGVGSILVDPIAEGSTVITVGDPPASADLTVTVTAAAPPGSTPLEELSVAISSLGGALRLPLSRTDELASSGGTVDSWKHGVDASITLTPVGATKPDLNGNGSIGFGSPRALRTDSFANVIPSSCLILYAGTFGDALGRMVEWSNGTSLRGFLGMASATLLQAHLTGGFTAQVDVTGLANRQAAILRRTVVNGVATEVGLRVGERAEVVTAANSSPAGDATRLTIGASRHDTPATHSDIDVDGVLFVDTTGLTSQVVEQIVALLLAYAEDELEASIAQPPVSPTVTSLVSSPTSVSIQVGQGSGSVLATVKDQSGQPMAGVTLGTVIDDTAKATVPGASQVTDAAGQITVLVSPVAEGPANLTISHAGSGLSTVTPISVLAAAPPSGQIAYITVTPSSDTIELGNGTSFFPNAYDAQGNFVDEQTYTWEIEGGSSTVISWTTVGKVLLVSGIGLGVQRVRVDVLGVKSPWVTITVQPSGVIGTFYTDPYTGIIYPVEYPRAEPDKPDFNTWTPTRVVNIATAGALNAALADLQDGDDLVLLDGVNFSGKFTLPARVNFRNWLLDKGVRIRTANTGGWLPAIGVDGWQVLAPVKANGAKILRTSGASGDGAIHFAANANGYWLDGLDVGSSSTAACTALIRADDFTASNTTPHHICMTRMVVRGSTALPLGRCLQANWEYFYAESFAFVDAVRDSASESKAIVSWAHRGIWKLRRGHMSAQSITIMFGGADPAVATVTPEDITIEHCHHYKDLAWKALPTGSSKNLNEIKAVRRVYYYANLYENHYAVGQWAGHNFKPTTPTAGAYARDIIMVKCVTMNAHGGISMSGNPAGTAAEPLNRVVIADSLFLKLGKVPDTLVSGAGSLRAFQFIGCRHLIMLRNTWLGAANKAAGLTVVFGGMTGEVGFVFKDNVMQQMGATSWKRDSTAEGAPSITAATASDRIFDNNLLGATVASRFSGVGANNLTVVDTNISSQTNWHSHFVNYAAETLAGAKIAPTSPAATMASHGGAVGAPIDELIGLIAGVRLGGDHP